MPPETGSSVPVRIVPASCRRPADDREEKQGEQRHTEEVDGIGCRNSEGSGDVPDDRLSGRDIGGDVEHIRVGAGNRPEMPAGGVDDFRDSRESRKEDCRAGKVPELLPVHAGKNHQKGNEDQRPVPEEGVQGHCPPGAEHICRVGQGKDGADGINGAIGVKGADGKDGVTISSIGKDGTNGTDGHIGINGKDGASADIHVVKGVNGVDGTDGYNGTDGIDRIVYEDHNGNTQTVATMNDGMKYGGDVGNVISKKLNGQVNVVGGITDSSKLSTEDNIGVVSDGSDNLKVRLSKDLKGLDSVTTKTVTADTGNITTVNASTVNVGDTTITTGGMTIQNGSAGQDVTLNKDGLNNGGNKITNVAPGDISSTSTDAVNGSQLYRAENRISRLGDRVNRVGAGAAALAGLHPLDFDPDDKWDFAAGYGNYKDAHAVAIGAYYRPNEDTMFSVGGSFSGGENMVNVGVSWKFGQKNHISRSRVSMAKDMLAMKNQIETLTKKLAAYESGQPAKAIPASTHSMNFPDVPEIHWAYQYVKTLAEKGYLEGYPDGEFKGDRSMTRYEYAAIIYRALQNGAPSDGNMARSVDEFGPELVKVQNIDRFRVDRISGKDNDRHKVERVRINDKDDKNRGDFRDVYGSHIQKS